MCGHSCENGVCVKEFNEPFCVFNSLGVNCAKRKDVPGRLRAREQLNIDPFETGFSYGSHSFKVIDFNIIRLAFQVFLFDKEANSYSIALEPIVSQEIYDKKAMYDLAIVKLSHTSSHISGGGSVVMLCDRVLKGDIQVRFYQKEGAGASKKVVWEKMANFKAR